MCSKLIKSRFSGLFLCLVTCFRVTLENVFVVAQKRVLWYIINEKGQPPTRWVAEILKQKIRPYSRQSFGVVFLCSNYFLVLHKSVNSGILKMKRDNRPQGGLPKCLSRNSAHTLVKVLGRFFYA